MWECHQQLRTDGRPVQAETRSSRRKPSGQRERTGGITENSDVFDKAGLHGLELISGLGLQLLPQVYGLLYARPSSAICVSWATEDCLQAPLANTVQPPHSKKRKKRNCILLLCFLKGHTVTQLKVCNKSTKCTDFSTCIYSPLLLFIYEQHKIHINTIGSAAMMMDLTLLSLITAYLKVYLMVHLFIFQA